MSNGWFLRRKANSAETPNPRWLISQDLVTRARARICRSLDILFAGACCNKPTSITRTLSGLRVTQAAQGISDCTYLSAHNLIIISCHHVTQLCSFFIT